MSEANKSLAQLFRQESGKILASLIVFCRNLSVAEDALQEAYEIAMAKWPTDGWPTHPVAWLHNVAKRKIIDNYRLHSQHKTCNQTHNIDDFVDERTLDDALTETEYDIPEERLRLIFTCCHPALSESAKVALTLKTLAGLTVKEIARAFLTSETTMLQRLTRAKAKILATGIAYQVPDKTQLTNRLPSVLAVLYLIYNESYNAFEGQYLSRLDLANEAIRLIRLSYELLPTPEVIGLLALTLLHDARRAARSNATCSYIPLAEQNRSSWDKNKISEANRLLAAAIKQAQPGVYQIQAAISALHVAADSWDKTDWQQIILLYGALYKLNPSPIVALNQSVAIANNGDLNLAYANMCTLLTHLHNYQPYFAALADIEGRLGLFTKAADSFERAIKLSKNSSEKAFLLAKKASVLEQLQSLLNLD
jgi:RNA polymerase sigma-70 factor, ECF subfamily